jgi:hypothetical protein
MAARRKLPLPALLALPVAAAAALPIAGGLATAGCGSPANGTLKLVTGEEDAAATFAGVTTVNVTWYDMDASPHPLATALWPAASIDLGSVDQSSVGMIEVTGSNASGEHLVFGSSIPVPFGAFAGVTVPLFVQRVGQMARLPLQQPLSDGRPLPLLGLIGGRYVLVAGGADPASASASQLYDLLAFGALSSPPTLPVVPESMAVAGTIGYLVTSDGVTAYDFSDSDAGTFALPAGTPTAGDIAGGATVTATDGTQYIVGGTRTVHDPTTAVLRIDTTGTASWISLTVPRWGASAVWIDPVGLVVIGGSPSAPGVEVIAAGANTTVALPLSSFPADPTVSAGAATLDDAHQVLVAGGMLPDLSDPGVRVLDLQCAVGACAPTSWGPLPVPLVRAYAFALPVDRQQGGDAGSKTSAAVVGSELLGGRTHVFVVGPSGATEIPTRVPHTNANAVASPVGVTPGAFLLFGGAPEIESFAPPF